jgi:hypothetical protein
MKKQLMIWLLILLGSTMAKANFPDNNSHLSEPDSLKQKKKITDFVRFKAGAIMSSFFRPDISSSNGVLTNPLWSWQAGIASDFFKRKYHYSRAELSFSTKGAKEYFTSDGVEIESINQFRNLQLSVLPIVLRAEPKTINPSVGVGVYVSQRLSGSSKTGINGEKVSEDPVSLSFFDVKQDFGIVLNLEVMYKKHPGIEIRYEAGLKSQSTLRDIKNRALVFSFIF